MIDPSVEEVNILRIQKIDKDWHLNCGSQDFEDMGDR